MEQPELVMKFLTVRGHLWQIASHWLSNPCCFWKKTRETPKRARVSLFAEPLISLERKGKTHKKKPGKSSQREKQGDKKKGWRVRAVLEGGCNSKEHLLCCALGPVAHQPPFFRTSETEKSKEKRRVRARDGCTLQHAKGYIKKGPIRPAGPATAPRRLLVLWRPHVLNIVQSAQGNPTPRCSGSQVQCHKGTIQQQNYYKIPTVHTNVNSSHIRIATASASYRILQKRNLENWRKIGKI